MRLNKIKDVNGLTDVFLASAFLIVMMSYALSASACVTEGLESPHQTNEYYGEYLPSLDQSQKQSSSLVDSANQVIGSYTNGTLVNPSTIPSTGTGFHKMFPNRDRKYSAERTLAIIQLLGSKMKANFPKFEKIQIGDVAQLGGGPMYPTHASHQTGLEFDAVYLRMNHQVQPIEDESGFVENFVKDGLVTDNFASLANLSLFKWAVETGRVGRIFVGEKIKKHLCLYSKRKGLLKNELILETLRRLRPWDHHDDHFHLRLKCPVGSTQCVEQKEPKEGTGCEEVVRGW